MTYLRSKKIKRNTYYYVVEGKLIRGKVKQKVKLYLGNIKNIIKVFDLYRKKH